MSLFRPNLDEWFGRIFAWSPLVSNWMTASGATVEETDEAVLVKADAPGFEPADFDIQVSEDTLTIMAEHKVEGKEKEKTPTIERRLERALTLPSKVDPEKVEAKYHHGVLELRLVRTEPIKHRKIEVKAA
jgi:HSP20 family protein